MRSVPARVANRPDAGELSKARCSQPPTTRCQSPNPKHKKLASSTGFPRQKKIKKVLLYHRKVRGKSDKKPHHFPLPSPLLLPRSLPLLRAVPLKLPASPSLRPHRVINPLSPSHPDLAPTPPPFQSPNPPGARAPNPPSHFFATSSSRLPVPFPRGGLH